MNQRVTYPLFIVMFSQLCAMDHDNFKSLISSTNGQDFETLLAKTLVLFDVKRPTWSEQLANQRPGADTTPIAQVSNAPSKDLERSPHAQNNMPMNRYMSHFFPQKNFPCNFGCGNSFNSQHSLREHERKKHSEMAEHKCSMCQKAFFSYQGLCQHIRKQHS